MTADPSRNSQFCFPWSSKLPEAEHDKRKISFCYFLKDEQIKGHMTTLSEILENPDFADFHHIVKEVNGMYDWIREKMCSVINGILISD